MGSRVTEFAEVIKFRFGAPVVASDGASGTVDHVIVDPGARTVTHVGVKLSRFSRHIYSVPVELVLDARAEEVQLSCARSAIPQQAQSIVSGFVRLNASTTVELENKRLGRLAQVSADKQTLAILRIVVDRGLSGGEALVPIDATTSFEGRRISIRLTTEQTLVAYRRDGDLLREVNEALFDYPRLRVDMRGMEARAIDGAIWLRGHVSSELNSRLAADQLQGIPGLAAIYNELVADTDLAPAVAATLAADPRTHGQHIGVYPDLGVVYLRGAVSTPTARDAASEIAEAVPGVAQTVNELVVRPGADVVPTMASVTSQEDLVPGGG